jgi:hypothetical protein
MTGYNARLAARHDRGEDHPRFDDVRCFRCGRWRHPDATTTTKVDVPIGTLTVAVCGDADDCQAHHRGARR